MKPWAIREVIHEGIDGAGRHRNIAKMALEELHTIEQSLSELEAKDAERIAIGKALGWLMEASEVNLGSGDDEFNEAWLNAESVMCDMPQGAFLTLEQLREIEWIHRDPLFNVRQCPVCHHYETQTDRHAPDCWLAALLKDRP